jgi:ribosomal peptide maturation radical SAM protein 1
MNGVALVAMPWASPETPSIQIGLLSAVLARAGVPSTAHSLHLEVAGFFVENGVALEHVEGVSHQWWRVGLGEWIFARAQGGRACDDDADYLRYLAREQVPDPIVAAAQHMRELVPEFLQQATAEILESEPRLVGFTTTFAQTLPSLALAAQIKAAYPDVVIVFGGANCDGVLGKALLEAHPVIDFVVQGRAEASLPRLCRAVLAGQPPGAEPGLLGRSPAVASAPATPTEADWFRPDYDEYYGRLQRSALRDALLPRTRLVIETARGCWWGERQHCTFCGLNGSSMAFKSAAADQVLADITALAARYKRTEFDVVDNILDPTFFDHVLPELARRRRHELDYRFFWEIKANMSPHQIRLLRDAGVQRIQPGIESLSSRILRLMRKGVTALQNVKLLVFAAGNDLMVTWNIIYGIPGETEDDYLAMADMMPSLVHLKPPGLVRLQVQRFSPYFDESAAYGLRLVGPAHYYRHLYAVDATRLPDLAYAFEHEYVDGHDPERAVAPVRRALEHWDRSWSPGKHHSLRYERGPGYLRLRERRPGFRSRDIVLEHVEAELYLACRTVATPAGAVATVERVCDIQLGIDEVRRFLVELSEARLVLREGDRFLALALPLNPDADPPAAPAPKWKLSRELAH